MSGRPPFAGRKKEEIYRSIKSTELSFQDPFWDKISKNAKDFIATALKRTQGERPSADELLSHPWMEQASRATELDSDTQLDIANNLKVFKNATTFQSGILSLLANLNTSSSELDMLKKMFFKLDEDKSGTLTIDEIKRGMDQIESLGLGSGVKRSSSRA